jgi:hypothetical protein
VGAGTLPRMADDVSPSSIEARQFDIVRRGYDRAQADEYFQQLSAELERLQGLVEDRRTKELKVGLDDPEALALELGSIGGEVAAILEAARAAADGMRGRAAADVDEWRTTAENETNTLTSDATEQSQSMRAAAWNEGTSMLSSAKAEAATHVHGAKDDALFIRAEAEREAIRLTGDAKRDREELIRSARLEAEEVIEGARRESDGMLAAASQQAEQAQERARALEDRRAELLSELESTRASIGHLEEEIDSRRQALEVPEPVEEPASDPRSHHGVDSGSVRIVAPSRSRKLKPVDAEELVADVVALRSATPVVPALDLVPTPAPAEVETVAVIAPPVAETSTEEASSDEAQPHGGIPAPEGTPEPESGTDEIGSLFASLRDDAVEPPQSIPEAADVAEVVHVESPPVRSEPMNAPDAEPEVQEVGEEVTNQGEYEDAELEDMDVALIPLQNAALKEIKRTLVDLQNDALEHLRTDTDWVPKESFTNQFKKPFSDLAVGITDARDDGGAAKEFSADLNVAVIGVIVKARESGSGDREVASSVSRVFRMWRADESERRVVDAALALSSLR